MRIYIFGRVLNSGQMTLYELIVCVYGSKVMMKISLGLCTDERMKYVKNKHIEEWRVNLYSMYTMQTQIDQIFSRQRQIIVSLVLTCMLFWILILGWESQFIQLLRIVCGSIYMLFLPWWWLTDIFFSTWDLDWLERFALSFALSISVVPLLVFYANLVWIPITEIMVWWIVLWLMLVCRGWVWYKQNKAI